MSNMLPALHINMQPLHPMLKWHQPDIHVLPVQIRSDLSQIESLELLLHTFFDGFLDDFSAISLCRD